MNDRIMKNKFSEIKKEDDNAKNHQPWYQTNDYIPKAKYEYFENSHDNKYRRFTTDNTSEL